MPASKAEQVLDALKAVLETVPDAPVERNRPAARQPMDAGLGASTAPGSDVEDAEPPRRPAWATADRGLDESLIETVPEQPLPGL